MNLVCWRDGKQTRVVTDYNEWDGIEVRIPHVERIQEVIWILQDLTVDFKAGEWCDVIYVFKNITFAAIQRVNFRQWYASKYLQLAIWKIYLNNSWLIAHSHFCGVIIAIMASFKLPMLLKVELKSDAHNWLLRTWIRQLQQIPDCRAVGIEAGKLAARLR